MASEIRVDKINSLSGVGTVTLSPTGVDIAGITTAATLKATTGIVTTLTVTTGIVTTLTTNTLTANSTAKVGSGVTLSPDGDVFTTGVTTATTFVGALTGNVTGNVTGTASGNAVLSGSTNNTVTTVTGANAIQGEGRLTYDGNGIFNITGTGAAGVFVITPDTVDGGIYFNDGSSNKGALTYLHSNETMNFRVNGTNKLTINSSGNLVLNSGSGIDFSATGDSSGTMSSELLDDYEEGTFTPTSNATLSSADGSYTKIGRQVTVHIRIQTGSSGSGSQFVVSGMPFSASMPSGLSNGSVPCGFGYISGSVYNGGVQLHMVRDGTNLYFFNFGTSLTIANLASRDMRFGLVYHTAT